MKLTSLCIAVFLIYISCKKNIAPTEEKLQEVTSLIPLTDFGNGFFRGYTGGLYPDGNNHRPEAHSRDGIAIAGTVKPLNPEGLIDEEGGKIVWLSVGMSNATQETQSFLQLMNSFSEKNPKLRLVDGAVGGEDISAIDNRTAPYWNMVLKRLSNASLTSEQVQVIWSKEAEAHPTDTAFVSYPDALKAKYKNVMQILKEIFPNLKLVYLSSRSYVGYATTNLNPEPFAWYSGWAVKRLIEDQINGDPRLSYAGRNPSSAWLSWGPYLWANGSSPRSDGLTWVPSDFLSDGTHPSQAGRQKVAAMLLDFFSNDETSKCWFLKH